MKLLLLSIFFVSIKQVVPLVETVIGFMSCPEDEVAGEFPAWVVVSTEGAGQVLIPPLEPATQPAQRDLFALLDASDLEAAAYGCVFLIFGCNFTHST